MFFTLASFKDSKISVRLSDTHQLHNLEAKHLPKQFDALPGFLCYQDCMENKSSAKMKPASIKQTVDVTWIDVVHWEVGNAASSQKRFASKNLLRCTGYFPSYTNHEPLMTNPHSRLGVHLSTLYVNVIHLHPECLHPMKGSTTK